MYHVSRTKERELEQAWQIEKAYHQLDESRQQLQEAHKHLNTTQAQLIQQLTVESTEGEGATFLVTLPREGLGSLSGAGSARQMPRNRQQEISHPRVGA